MDICNPAWSAATLPGPGIHGSRSASLREIGCQRLCILEVHSNWELTAMVSTVIGDWATVLQMHECHSMAVCNLPTGHLH